MIPSRCEFSPVPRRSPPKASSAAATAYCAIELVRRRRGCAKKPGLDEIGGTLRTLTDGALEGPGRSIVASDLHCCTTSRRDATPHPAGDTAPKPFMYTTLRSTS